MELHRAFEVVKGDVIAFTGAGGKTSTLVGLGYELYETGWRVLATTTTRIGEDQLDLFPYAIHYTEGVAAISAALNQHGYVFLYGEIRAGKVHGTPPEIIPQLLDNVDSDVLLIEADGARGLPFKAPYAHEPVIPEETTLVVPVTSLSVLGKPLDEEHVYNPQAMIDKFGFYDGSKIRLPWIAQVMRDEEMGLKAVPDGARVIAFINQTPDKGYLKTRARHIARLALRSRRLHGVALGSVRAADPIIEVQRPVGAIVLAAGQSSRMGRPKVLLPWSDGQTMIEHIVRQLLLAKVDEIVVVTGFYADEVRSLMEPMGIRTVYNRAHKTGEMLSSLQTGLRALPEHIAAALIVLGDQPHLQPKVIGKVLKAYCEGAGHIVAPSYQMRRGHPILIGRRYWKELLALEKGGVPRDVINAHEDEIAYVNVDSDSVLQDVDTPSEYREALRKAGLNDYLVDLKKPDSPENA